MTEIITGIYVIECIPTGKIYVGSSQNISIRKYRHFMYLRQGKSRSPKLQNAYNKYGESAFKFTVIEECDKSELLAREQFYIDTWQPQFNSAAFAKGGGPKGWKQSPKEIERLRQAKKGNTYRAGHKNSLEHRAKLLQSLIGRKVNDATRKVMSESQKKAWEDNKHKRKKAPHTAEARAKMSKAHKGQLAWNKGIPASEEAKRKLSEYMKGRDTPWLLRGFASAEHEAKFRAATKGRKCPEEEVRRRAVAVKAGWAKNKHLREATVIDRQTLILELLKQHSSLGFVELELEFHSRGNISSQYQIRVAIELLATAGSVIKTIRSRSGRGEFRYQLTI